MITFQITANVKENHRVVVTLLPEVPTGLVELVVAVECATSENSQPRTGMANWAEAQAGQNRNGPLPTAR